MNDDKVRAFVGRLAAPPVQPSVQIGSRFTGRREFLWDSRSGVYSESLPLFGFDEQIMQAVLAPASVLCKREPKDVRQR